MISVLLPTAGRPDMLRTVLNSICHQTSVREIVEIIVSENGEDPRSGTVCSEFPQLPITYICRDKPLPVTEHFMTLFRSKLKGELTAMVHDDDWWAPEHLEKALQALKKYPEASVYHSSHFNVFSESSPLACSDNFAFWFGANFPAMDSPWVLNRESVFLGSLLGTGASYSSLVARTRACEQAAEIYETKNAFDNDRMLTFALTAYGPLVYQPIPYVYYRQHPGQDTNAYTIQRRARQMVWTTEWLIEQMGRDFQFVGDLFAERTKKCPASSRALLWFYAQEPWCLPLLLQHSSPRAQIAEVYRSLRPPPWKVFLKQILPPFLIFTRYQWLGRQ